MVLFFIAIASVIAQMTIVSNLGPGIAYIDLPLIILVFFSLKKGYAKGALLGLFLGTIRGAIGIDSIWGMILVYTVTGFAVGYVGGWFYKEKLLTFIL